MKPLNLIKATFLFSFFYLQLFQPHCLGQTPPGVGIGILIPDSSALLDLNSSNQGLLVPRLNTNQITQIHRPANGLMVYNTNDACYWFYNNTSWHRLCTTDSIGQLVSDSLFNYAWSLKGNTITNNKNAWLGTINSHPLTVKTHGKTALVIDSNQYSTFASGINVSGNGYNANTLNFGLTFGSNKKAGIISPIMPAWNKPELYPRGLCFITGNRSRIVIDTMGNVGIGSVIPLIKKFSVGDSNRVTIDSLGHYVGISGSSTLPSIALGYTNNGYYSSNAYTLNMMVHGATVFQYDIYNKNIKLGDDGSQHTQLPVGRFNSVLGNLSVNGNSNLGLASGGFGGVSSSLVGFGNIFIGSASSIKNACNVTLLGQSNIVDNTAMGGLGVGDVVIGSENALYGSVSTNSDNYIIGRNDTVRNSTARNFLIGDQVTLKNSGGNTVLVPSWFGQGGRQITFTGMNNSMVALHPGGYYFITSTTFNSGVSIGPGGGSWTFLSDRIQKENIRTINVDSVLKKLMQLSVTQWNYISQRPDPTHKLNHYEQTPLHLGCFAQDYKKLFGYGEFEDAVTISDYLGVLTAAIQALEIKSQHVDELEQQLKGLELRFLELEKKLAPVKQ